MTVTTVATALTYEGNGLTTSFVTPFFVDDADIVALFRNSAGGLATLALNSDYTVAGGGSPGGGTLTIINPSYVPNFADDGTKLVVDTAIAATQAIDLPEGGPFPSSAVEGELDKLTRLVQQLLGSTSRSLRSPIGDLAGDMALPLEAIRAGKVLYFDPTTGLPSLKTPLELSLLPASLPQYPLRTTADVGLNGDGLTDDSFLLQQDLDVRGALASGTTYTLVASDGKSFYLANRLRVPSNIQLIFMSPVSLAPKAGIDIVGSLATVTGKVGAKLLSDATAGATSLNVDTTPLGGGSLSSYYSAGEVICITGLKDGCSSPLEEQVVRVTAVTDGSNQLTLAEALSYAFQATYTAGSYQTNYGSANQTLISVVKQAALTVDGAEGGNVVTVSPAKIGNLSVGDWVILQDEKLQSDIGGLGDGYVHREIARIDAIGEGGIGNVRLHRRLSRTYETAKNATLVVMNPVQGSSLQGATAVFTAVADSTPWSTFKAKWAVDCSISQCRVPNVDSFGSRGNGFRRDYCFNVDLTECSFQDPKYSAAGEGYANYLTFCTACPTYKLYSRAARHTTVRYCTTDCNAWGTISENCLQSDIDWHGGDEYGSVEFDCTVTGGSATAGTSLAAFTFGDATGLGGTRACGVQGGKCDRFNAAIGYAVRFEAGTSGNRIVGVTFKNIYQLMYHSDIAGYPALIASDNTIENCLIENVADWVIYAVGNANGSTYRTLDKFRFLNNTLRNVSKVFNLVQLGEIEFSGNDIGEITEDVSYTYFIYGNDILTLIVQDNRVTGMPRGLSLTTCPNYIISDNVFASSVHGTVLDCHGGCSGGTWTDNDTPGYEPTCGRTSTDIMIEAPRVIGGITLANNTSAKTTPPGQEGRAFIKQQGSASVFADIVYSCNSSPKKTASIIDTGAAWYFGDGTLTGTTNATTPSISVTIDTSGNLNLENRSGSQETFDIIWSP